MIETLTLNEAAAYLRRHGMSIANTVLADGLEQGKYSFGLCVVSSRGSRSFQIFKTLLDQWIAERTVRA